MLKLALLSEDGQGSIYDECDAEDTDILFDEQKGSYALEQLRAGQAGSWSTKGEKAMALKPNTKVLINTIIVAMFSLRIVNLHI
ncbi:hypothetical protein A0J61_07174 [Choanephora cucurbitarum]|uniref:Uncharacterized protein n=1 Tax=Choanephora cucurbitarum TaxID=101091 RepID=A0A1C7N6U3_9FUNG|nr:hypothetical protein A0J61_07174 [Choanephora cucurbitarum]